jgi:hypothetical protein
MSSENCGADHGNPKTRSAQLLHIRARALRMNSGLLTTT